MGLLKTILELGLKNLAQQPVQVSTSAAEPGEIIPARCSCYGESFGIVLEIAGNKLSARQGIRYPQYSGNAVLHYKSLFFQNGITRSSDYKCPICGKRSFVQCKKCKKISCYDESGWFSCAYCGNQGLVFGGIHHTQGLNCEVYRRKSVTADIDSVQPLRNTYSTADQTVFQECKETTKTKGGELWTTL